MPARTRWALRIALAVAGLAIWLTAGGGVAQWHRQLSVIVALVLAIVVTAIPRSRRIIETIIDHAAHPTPRKRAQTAVFVAIVASMYLAFTAHRQGRYLRPVWHDEHSYAVQARMLAAGHLSMPPHPTAEFFESYYVITTDRAHASIYPIGATLFHVPAAWLGLPPSFTPVLLAGIVAGLLYRLLAELLDGAAGLLGALMLIATQPFRTFSTMLMSQPPTLLLALLMPLALLRLKRTGSPLPALAIGAFAGLAAITRPIDALALTLPVGIAMLAVAVRASGRRAGAARILFAIAAALPFLLLQLHVNRSVTGRALAFPWSLYVERDMPGAAVGFHPYSDGLVPRSSLPQKQAFYDSLRHLLQAHTPANVAREWANVRLRAALASTLPHGCLLALALPGLLLWRRGRWVLFLSAATLAAAHALYFLYDYYLLVAAPAVIALAIAGVRAFSVNRAARAALCTFVALLCFLCLPEANPKMRDQYFDPALIRSVDEWTAEYQGPPALVLFTYSTARRRDEEPVYNTTTANPDDAHVIRAHDLGPTRNQEIIRYYAAAQPTRIVYRFHDATAAFERLGRVADLVEKPAGKP